EFLANLTDLNAVTRETQFADFHSHGWVFRAVFKRDRHGNLLDYNNKIVPETTPALRKASVEMPLHIKEMYHGDAVTKTTPQQRHAMEAHYRAGVPVHLLDVHAEKGMHCVDCHFVQDMHGNTRLQMEVRAGIEIQCVDCHGTYTDRATLRTTGPA